MLFIGMLSFTVGRKGGGGADGGRGGVPNSTLVLLFTVFRDEVVLSV
jgi:hypothetical protein